MKKIKLLLCFILTFVIAGCSNSNKETEIKQTQVNITKESNLDSVITMTLAPTVAPAEETTITPVITKVVNVEDNELLDNITELSKSTQTF